MARILLVRHARTPATRRALFPHPSGVVPPAGADPTPDLPDRIGRSEAMALSGRLPAVDRCWSSHAVRTTATAELLGCADHRPTADLGGPDYGRWAGRSLSEVQRTSPADLAAWHADPDLAPHDGEPLTAVAVRVHRVLAAAATAGGTTLAVTDGEVLRTALLQVLHLPWTAWWQLDVAPCAVVDLRTTRGRGWRVHPDPPSRQTTPPNGGGREPAPTWRMRACRT